MHEDEEVNRETPTHLKFREEWSSGLFSYKQLMNYTRILENDALMELNQSGCYLEGVKMLQSSLENVRYIKHAPQSVDINEVYDMLSPQNNVVHIKLQLDRPYNKNDPHYIALVKTSLKQLLDNEQEFKDAICGSNDIHSIYREKTNNLIKTVLMVNEDR